MEETEMRCMMLLHRSFLFIMFHWVFTATRKKKNWNLSMKKAKNLESCGKQIFERPLYFSGLCGTSLLSYLSKGSTQLYIVLYGDAMWSTNIAAADQRKYLLPAYYRHHLSRNCSSFREVCGHHLTAVSLPQCNFLPGAKMLTCDWFTVELELWLVDTHGGFWRLNQIFSGGVSRQFPINKII